MNDKPTIHLAGRMYGYTLRGPNTERAAELLKLSIFNDEKGSYLFIPNHEVFIEMLRAHFEIEIIDRPELNTDSARNL